MPSHDGFDAGEDADETEATDSPWAESQETVLLRREESVEEDSDDDGQEIVVEDEYDDGSGPLVCPLPTVRRQEYRQLFAKLRRG